MKGVSAIIVTILLLMISVSLASFGYIFFTHTFTSITETGSEVVEQVSTSMLAGMKIDSLSESTNDVFVRNTGKTNLTQFSVYVNDIIDSSISVDIEPLSPGQIATITLSSTLNPGDVVKVTPGEGAIAIKSVPGGSSGGSGGSTCPDGTCSSGENCPADAGACTEPTRCYLKSCTNGCNNPAITVASGFQDNEGSLLCNDAQGCATPPCECDGAGSCVPKTSACPSSPTSYPANTWDRVWCDMTFSTKLADAPEQSVIQFTDDWGSGAVGGISNDNIGFRSGSTINFPTTGTYTFDVGSDDGVRVWIDGNLELDMWIDRGYTIDTFTKSLTAGNHQVRIDYYENVGSASVSFSYTPPTSTGPIGFWNFDGDTLDSSGNGNDGTRGPSCPDCPQFSAGINNNGLDFDGSNDYVNLGDNFDTLSEGSILWWVNFDDNTTPSTQRFWGKEDNYEVRWDGTTITFDMGGTAALATAIKFERSRWYHLAFTWNSTASYFYVDGIARGTGTTFTLPNTATQFHIGEGGSNRGSQNFNGLIDEVKIWDRALTQTEVQQEYQSYQSLGPVGFWHFDEGSGTTTADASGNGNTGTLVNGVTWTTTAHSGRALSFDGNDDYVIVYDSGHPELDLTDQLTITAWIRLNGWGEGTFGRIIDKNYDNTYMFYVRSASSSTSLGIDNSYSASTTALSLGTWYHVAVTFNMSAASNQIRHYVNGNPAGTGSRTIAIPTSTDNLYIGNSYTTGSTFSGIIDEVKIWNRALTATEIVADYNS